MKEKRFPREKRQVIHKGILICLTTEFSAEILLTRREWHKVFIVLKLKKKLSTKNAVLNIAIL
jgi:hypothetical protein